MIIQWLRRYLAWWDHYREPHYPDFAEALRAMWVARNHGLINRSYRSCPCGGWTLRVSR
jgi:hypothetical protein